MRTLIVAAVVLLAVPALAQETPAVDIGVGYAFMRDNEIDENFPLGWLASLNYNLSRGLAVTGEIGGSYKSVEEEGVTVDLSVHTLMGGLRFMSRSNESLHPYLQVLAGGARASAGASAEGVDVSLSNTNFAVQPGAGLDFKLGENLSLRLGADYRWIKGEDGGDSTSEVRGHAGIAFGVGSRN